MNKLNLVKRLKSYNIRMKDTRKQNMAILKAYLKVKSQFIVKNTQRRMIRGALWVGLLSVSYYFAHKIYSQRVEVQKMERKLTKFYPNAVTKVQTQKNHEIYYIVPQFDDQLANIISLCWRFHYKVIVRSECIDRSQLKQEINKLLADVPQNVSEKCIIINLQKLNKFQFDQLNNTIKVQSGISCKQVNEKLRNLGYQQIFPHQIAQNPNQTIYNSIVNNYPSNQGPLISCLINLDMISAQGKYFNSSNQNNQYGATPNLNCLFVGTGGIFGIPIRTLFKINPKNQNKLHKVQQYQIQSNDINQNIIISRKIKQFSGKYNSLISVQTSKSIENEKLNIKVTDKLQNGVDIFCSLVSQLKQQVPQVKKIQRSTKPLYNIFFSTNQHGYQSFLLFQHKNRQQKLYHSYENNLLKVNCQNESLLIQLISNLSSQNSVVVWCKNTKFLKTKKKMLDQNEVGSQLMRILVQIRQGIDHKKIYYHHNRYQEYFAKSTFRKLTEIFW